MRDIYSYPGDPQKLDATVQIFVARRADKQDFCTSYLGSSV
jgi:hypothetical protein